MTLRQQAQVALDSTRAEQLQRIAEAHGFDTVSDYLDDHIRREWARIEHSANPLPGFEIRADIDETHGTVVILTGDGLPPVWLLPEHAHDVGTGIQSVVNGECPQISVETPLLGGTLIRFNRESRGYRLMVMEGIQSGGRVFTRDMTASLALDIAQLLKDAAERPASEQPA